MYESNSTNSRNGKPILEPYEYEDYCQEIDRLWEKYGESGIANLFAKWDNAKKFNGYYGPEFLKRGNDYRKVLRMTVREAEEKVFGDGYPKDFVEKCARNGTESTKYIKARYTYILSLDFYSSVLNASFPRRIFDSLENVCHMDYEDALDWARNRNNLIRKYSNSIIQKKIEQRGDEERKKIDRYKDMCFVKGVLCYLIFAGYVFFSMFFKNWPLNIWGLRITMVLAVFLLYMFWGIGDNLLEIPFLGHIIIFCIHSLIYLLRMCLRPNEMHGTDSDVYGGIIIFLVVIIIGIITGHIIRKSKGKQ